MKKLLTLVLLINTTAFAQQKELKLTSDALGYDVDYYENLEKRLDEIKTQSIEKPRDTRLAVLSNSVNTSIFETNQLRNGTNIYNKDALEITDKIIKFIHTKNPDYGLQNAHTFISRSSVVNAYATDNGNVWVTLGLLSRIENEAQLAFILCHEVAHFIQKHSYEKVVNASEKINLEQGNELQVHDYSRQKEMEADSLGLILYQNLGYSYDAIPQVFDILAHCQLSLQHDIANKNYPFTNIAFDSSIAIGRTFNQNTIENDDDKFSTHPSIGSRREIIARLLTNVKKLNSDKFFIHGNQNQYNVLREKACYTLSDIYLTENDYLNAITNNEYLLDKYPEDEYIKYNLMMGWINAAHQIKTKYERNDTDYLFERNFDVYELIYQTKSTILFANLLLSVDSLYQTNTENADYLHAYNTSIALFASHFKKTNLNSKKDLISELTRSKIGDTSIAEIANKLEAKLDNKVVSELLNPEEKSSWTLNDLGNNQILFLNPSSITVDYSQLIIRDVIQNIEDTKNLQKSLEKICTQYKINHKVISITDEMKNSSAIADDIFMANQIFRITELSMKDSFEENLIFNYQFSPYEAKYIKEKYDSRYLGYLFNINLNPGRFKMGALAFKIIILYGLFNTMPQMAMSTFMERYEKSFFLMIYDLEENKIVLINERKIPKSSHSQMLTDIQLQSLIYDQYGYNKE
jgi:hypothetical protein